MPNAAKINKSILKFGEKDGLILLIAAHAFLILLGEGIIITVFIHV